MSQLRMAFYGDDFTGSTDAMESLALAGIRTRLFTSPPTPEVLASHPDLQAFGVAGFTRACSPDKMRALLASSFRTICSTGVPIIHYKVCSTFDSSPTLGSIGCAIDTGAEVFKTRCVPIVGGAPHLGRYCAFGNLFARSSGDSNPLRLDRHPNMRNHPITPMEEADLRLHLAWQTETPIALFDTTQLSDSAHYATLTTTHSGAVLIDFLSVAQAPQIGSLLAQHAQRERPLFVVGSSGVELALTAHWSSGSAPPSFPPAAQNGPLLVAVGSCSPVTARQLVWAEANGFSLLRIRADDAEDAELVRDATKLLQHGCNVAIHTGGTISRDANRDSIATALALATRNIIRRSSVRRLLVAGGDTSGHIAQKLQLGSLEMIAPLVRGAPLCRATSKIPEIDDIEVVFKGGQIGGDDFFGVVQRGGAA